MKVLTIYKTVPFLLLCFFSSMTTAQQLEMPSVVQDFKKAETHTQSFFSAELMKELGSKALFTAKITTINLDSLYIGENSTYFRLKSPLDVCKQSFINETKYIVHTKCYRGQRELLNFVKTFSK